MRWFIALISFFIIQTALAKRMAPAEINPIKIKRGSIHQSFERNSKGFSVYVLMKDKAGDLKWKVKLFSRKYIPKLETDVQDIYLKSLRLEDSTVIALDEKGKVYEVDVHYGTLQKPAKPAEY